MAGTDNPEVIQSLQIKGRFSSKSSIMLGYLLTFLRLNNEGTFSISVQSSTVRFSGKVTFSGRLQKDLNFSLSGYRKLL